MGPQIKMKYVDRPQISETYVDLMEKAFFDGGLVHIELCVKRMDDPKPPKPPTGKKVTACRLVMPLLGLVDMVDKLNAIVGQLEKDGVIQRQHIAPPSAGGKPN